MTSVVGEYPFPQSLGGYDLTVQILGEYSRRHIVHFGNGERLVVANFKDFVDVVIENPRNDAFQDSVGLMGTFVPNISGEDQQRQQVSRKLARDGTTTIDDPTEFGLEW